MYLIVYIHSKLLYMLNKYMFIDRKEILNVKQRKFLMVIIASIYMGLTRKAHVLVLDKQ